MSIAKPYTDRAVRADVRRFIRLYPREQLDEAIVRYIGENFTPKLSPQKNENLLFDKDVIIGLVCVFYRSSLDEILTCGTKTSQAHRRHVLWYMMATRTALSSVTIGRMFGKHHTTIMAARNKIIIAYEKNPTVRQDVDAIIHLLPKIEAKTDEE